MAFCIKYVNVKSLIILYFYGSRKVVDYPKCNYKHNNILVRCHNCNQIRNTIGHPGANCIEKENTVHTK